MKITLTKLKVHRGMSEETLCFEAQVLLDGKPFVRASNRGHGACNEYVPLPGATHTVAQVEEHIRRQRNDAKMFEPLDTVIAELIDREEEGKRLKRWLKAGLVAITADNHCLTMTSRNHPLAALRAHALKQHPGARILNDLPFEEALDLFLATAALRDNKP
jgi:hypothetical protein